MEYDHFLALLRSDTLKSMLAKGNQMVTDFFDSHPTLDPRKFLMTPPPRDPAAVVRDARVRVSQSQCLTAAQARGLDEEEEEEEEGAGELLSRPRAGGSDEADINDDDDDDFFRRAGELNDVVAVSDAIDARGRKKGARSSRK